MLRTILTTLPLLVVAQSAWAVCPDRANLQGDLTCSSSYAGVVTAADDSYLGGECEDEACYSCGDPYANENQVAAEAIYSFECQLSGTVTMLITDLTCDLDIYVLDESCDPYTGCLHGSTSSYAEDDSVEFECVAGEVYHEIGRASCRERV